MNQVAVSAEEVPLPAWSENVSRYAALAIAETGEDNWDLSVLLCGDKTITELNNRYRNKNEATDVLSFELGIWDASGEADESGKRYLPGDIAISLDTLRENAARFGISEDEELRRLLIHGILHLGGMDHQTNNETEPMLVLQEQILAKLREERIMPHGENQ